MFKVKSLWLMFVGYCVCVMMAQIAVAADGAGGIAVDYRGIMDLGGGCSSNLIAFGPGWKYAAQDYCLKNIKKTGSGAGLQFESDFRIPGAGIKLIQTTREVTDAQGDKGLKLTYTLKHDSAFTLESAFVSVRLPVKPFVQGAVTVDGQSFNFPQDYEKEYLAFPKSASTIQFTSSLINLMIHGDELSVARVDMRKYKNEQFELRMMFPNTRNTTSSSVSFEIYSKEWPFVTKADAKWIVLPVTGGIQEGSILDFSNLTEPGPAGKFGRILASQNGHLVYEQKPQTRVKLMGTNVCFGANYLPKETADELASTFKKMGYNTIRFHHTDVDLIKGNWNAHKSDDIDPAQLDKLDYLMASMKKAGMYYSIDLYTMRRFGADEIADWNEYVDNPNVIKALVPLLPGAFDAWSKLALKWLNHVNPYTGMAMKDDPALLSICPVNEDTITSVWAANAKTRQLYQERFAQWKIDNHQSGDDKQNFARFLTELRMACNDKLARFFKDNGINALITGSNWWVTQAQTFTRNQFDVVDNHEYWDHPSPHYLPSRYNQRSDIRESISYVMPVFMMPTRIFGKPFTVTEWNFCAPNQYRAEAGVMMGAYSALQDWDALYRFAWSHSGKNITEQQAISGFDMSTDPLTQLTERLATLLFARGDVLPAQKKYVYGVTMHEATKNGTGDMWAKGLFPRDFTKQGLISQVGSQVITDKQHILGAFDAVVSEVELSTDQTAGNKFVTIKSLPNITSDNDEIISDTQQIMLNNKKGYVKVVTDRTECMVGPEGIDLAGKCLSVSGGDTFSSLSASAMDAKNLADSKRVLLMHLTNVLNSNMQFQNATMTTYTKRGDLPYLVRTASAKVELKNSNPNLKLYVVDFSGKRVGTVRTQYADGAYHFTASIAAGDQQPALIYELAAN